MPTDNELLIAIRDQLVTLNSKIPAPVDITPKNGDDIATREYVLDGKKVTEVEIKDNTKPGGKRIERSEKVISDELES